MQELKPYLGVLFFVLGSLGKQGGDLLVAVLLGAGSVIGVLVAGLRFAGEGRQQVGFGGGCP